MKDDTFSTWINMAQQRAIVRLMDGREATLMAVRKATRACKIMLGGRHYFVWIEDIALVKDPQTQRWLNIEPWRQVNLENRADLQVTTISMARESRSWLDVVPNPQALHPSFVPTTR